MTSLRPFKLPITNQEFAFYVKRCVPRTGWPKRLAIANSGGVDSTCLLFLWHRLLSESGPTDPSLPTSLISLHVNHSLQSSAHTMANSASLLPLRLSIPHLELPVLWGTRPFPNYPQSTHTERSARQARYHLFLEGMVRGGAGAICMGHHADDQVETALMRLSKGSTMLGLAGMRSVRTWGMGDDKGWPLGWAGSLGMGLSIVRPLLSLPKDRIVATCEEEGLEWYEDQTNFQPSLTLRNVIRHLMTHAVEDYQDLEPQFLEPLPIEIGEEEPDSDGGVDSEDRFVGSERDKLSLEKLMDQLTEEIKSTSSDPSTPSVLTPETAIKLYEHVREDLEARYARQNNPVPLELADGPESLKGSIMAIREHVEDIEMQTDQFLRQNTLDSPVSTFLLPTDALPPLDPEFEAYLSRHAPKKAQQHRKGRPDSNADPSPIPVPDSHSADSPNNVSVDPSGRSDPSSDSSPPPAPSEQSPSSSSPPSDPLPPSQPEVTVPKPGQDPDPEPTYAYKSQLKIPASTHTRTPYIPRLVSLSLVLRILRYVSPHPWGTSAASGGRHVLSLERIVHALWGFDPSRSHDGFEGEGGKGKGKGKGENENVKEKGKEEGREGKKRGNGEPEDLKEEEKESPFGFETYRPFSAGGKVLWTPVRIMREGGLLRLAGRYREGERWGWLVTRAPPEGAPLVSKQKGRKLSQKYQSGEKREKEVEGEKSRQVENGARGKGTREKEGEKGGEDEVKGGGKAMRKEARRADFTGVVRGVEMRVPRNERTLADDVTEEFVEAWGRASGAGDVNSDSNGVKTEEGRTEDSAVAEEEDAKERTKFRMLYDCRFLITFDFSKTPSHLRDIFSSLHQHQKNPTSSSSSPQIIIEPATRYYWPQVVLRQSGEPDIILATIKDKIAQLAEFNERKRQKGVNTNKTWNVNYGIWKQTRPDSAVERAMERLLKGQVRKTESEEGHEGGGDGEGGMKGGRDGREGNSEWVRIEFVRTLRAE